MIANHLRHVGAVEIVAAERAQPTAPRLLRGLGRRRPLDAVAASEARQLRVAAAVVGHHALAERAHGRTRRALRGDTPELDLGEVAGRGLVHELTILVTHHLDLSRRRAGQGDQRCRDDADDSYGLHHESSSGGHPGAARRKTRATEVPYSGPGASARRESTLRENRPKTMGNRRETTLNGRRPLRADFTSAVSA